jgi:hypothetical protein
MENNYLRGDASVEAVGWAEERREELELRKEEASVTRVQGQEHHLIRILEELTQMVVLLKLAVVLLSVLCSICGVLVLKK